MTEILCIISCGACYAMGYFIAKATVIRQANITAQCPACCTGLEVDMLIAASDCAVTLHIDDEQPEGASRLNL